MKCSKCGSKRIVEKKGEFVCKKCGEKLDWSFNERGDVIDENGVVVYKKKTPMQEFLEFVYPIIIALVVAVLLKSFVFANAQIPTGSMLNTIHQGDKVIASRLAYEFGDPERYDIMIFRFPDAVAQGNNKEYYVKRVIGLPGETVNITDGIVFVTRTDGTTIQLEDDYVTACEPTGSYGPYVVPEDSYFVLGDNRNNSMDSRFWASTNFVKKELAVGKVIFRYSPSFGLVE